MLCVIATPRPETLVAFARTLARTAAVLSVETGREALDTARDRTPALVVIDEGLPDFTPAGLARELIQVNALINTAILTAMAPEEFHESTEGLGVLAGLPRDPGPGDAERLLALVQSLG